MWEANTIQVPKELVSEVLQGSVSSDALLAFCLKVMYPDKSMDAIANRFEIDSSDASAADKYSGDSDTGGGSRKRPQRRNQSGSGNSERPQYDRAPAAPQKFRDWLRNKVEEAIPDSFEVRDAVADAIYEAAGGDKQYILDAIETTRDYHENKDEVRSPGAVVLQQLKRFDIEKLHSMAEAIRRNGTGIRERSTRMTRAAQRAEEYVREIGNPVGPDEEFFEDE